MSKSIRVTMVRPTTSTVWPFDLFPWSSTLFENFSTFEAAGIESWIIGNEDNDLTLVVDHYFPTDELFAAEKDSTYALLPMWCNSGNRADSESYCTDNGITVTMQEVDNPDLSAYTRITTARGDLRTFDALRALTE